MALRIAKICYSHWPQDVDVDRYFSILCNTLKYIDEEESVRIDRKSEYYAFVSSQINDEIMTIVMLQVVVSNNDDLTNLFDRIGFFENVCIDNVSLKKIRHLYFPTFTRNHDEVQVSDEGFEKYNKYESYTIADIYNEEEQIERVKNS